MWSKVKVGGLVCFRWKEQVSRSPCMYRSSLNFTLPVHVIVSTIQRRLVVI